MEHQDAPFPAGMVDEWQRFLDRPRHAVHVLDIFKTNTLFPLQRQAEMLAMLKLAATVKPKTYMEIGADKGGGLWAWCHSLPSLEQVIACEVRGLPYVELFERAFPKIKFLWLPDSSYHFDTVSTVKEWLKDTSRYGIASQLTHAEIDVLFIDGDKGQLAKDFDAYRSLVSDDGLILVHDVTDEVPGDAYHGICSRGYFHREIVDRSDWHRENELTAAGVPAVNPHAAWLRHWRGRSCGVGCVQMKEGPR